MYLEVRNAETGAPTGRITLVGGRLNFDDSLLWLQDYEVPAPEGDRRIGADADPQQFLLALTRYLTNGYVEAVLVE